MGYTASKLQAIDKTRYEDYLDAQGADTVIRRLVNAGTIVSRPKNPTKQTSIEWVAPADIAKGTNVTINLKNAGYPNLYDCTTWDNYTGSVEYDYIGYFKSKSAPETASGVFLVQKEGADTQNFAFPGMENFDFEEGE